MNAIMGHFSVVILSFFPNPFSLPSPLTISSSFPTSFFRLSLLFLPLINPLLLLIVSRATAKHAQWEQAVCAGSGMGPCGTVRCHDWQWQVRICHEGVIILYQTSLLSAFPHLQQYIKAGEAKKGGKGGKAWNRSSREWMQDGHKEEREIKSLPIKTSGIWISEVLTSSGSTLLVHYMKLSSSPRMPSSHPPDVTLIMRTLSLVLHLSSTSYCECKQKVNMRVAWERGYLFFSPGP